MPQRIRWGLAFMTFRPTPAAAQISPCPEGGLPSTSFLRSPEEITCLRSRPRTPLGMITVPPGETMIWSGLSERTSSGVTSVLSRTSMPSRSISLRNHATKGSRFSLSTWAMLRTPPSLRVRSIRTTWCPRSAAVRAASMPPGPAPTTTTRLRWSAGTGVGSAPKPSSGCATCGLIEHCTVLPTKMLSRQREQTMHRRICSA